MSRLRPASVLAALLAGLLLTACAEPTAPALTGTCVVINGSSTCS